MAQLTTPPRDYPGLAESVQRQISSGNHECTGCTPAVDGVTPEVCYSMCLTTCEHSRLAELQFGPGSYTSADLDSQIALNAAREAWVCRYAGAGKIRSMPTYHGEVWIAALYVALIQLGGGVGSIVPENFAEYVLFLLSIAVGSVTWAGVVGTICAVLTTSDPATLEFKQDMDSLNYFLADMSMPHELRRRAREYLRNKRDLYKKTSYNTLMDILSPELRMDMVLEMSGEMLKHVWYLCDLEPECLVELSLKMSRAVYAPREKIPADRLCILMRGVAAKAGNILTVGSTWCEDVIVSANALRDKRLASALPYAEIATLTRDDIDDVLESFPKSKRMVTEAAMKIAMQRAIVVVSEFMKLTRDRRPHSASSPAGAPAGAPAAPTEKPGIMALFEEKRAAGQLDGAAIIPFLTGQPLIDPEDEDEEEGMSPKPVRHGADGELAALTRKLDAQGAEQKALASQVEGMKRQLDKVVSLLEAKA